MGSSRNAAVLPTQHPIHRANAQLGDPPRRRAAHTKRTTHQQLPIVILRRQPRPLIWNSRGWVIRKHAYSKVDGICIWALVTALDTQHVRYRPRVCSKVCNLDCVQE